MQVVFREKKYQVTDECVVCLGAYHEDFDENGWLVREWLQCTSKSCAKWMHQHCLRIMTYAYVAYVEASFVKIILHIMQV